MIRRILVPLDGSRQAEGILPHVLVLAQSFDASVDLLHVVPISRTWETRGPADPIAARMARAHWCRYLEARADELCEAGLQVSIRVEEGSPPTEILNQLNVGENDLVALSAHGSGNDRSLQIGCTAASVLLNSGRGILLAPGRAGKVAPYRRILVPVDCSPRSDWSLGVAGSIALASGARLKVVHVLDCPEVISRLPDTSEVAGFVKRLREVNRAEARRYLDEVAWRLDAQGIHGDCEIVESSASPAEALLRITADGSDLVIVSAHGRGASPSWPLGSTAAKLALWAQRPILVLQDQPTQRSRSPRAHRSSRALAGEWLSGY